MNITSMHPITAYPTQEPPRTSHKQDQESSRPVLAPTRSEPMAPEVRRGDERKDGRETRADSSADAHTKSPAPESGQAKTAKDSLVGAVLDVFA